MALFGDARDVSLFRHFNRELLHNIIDISIDWYKLNLNSLELDTYGETGDKTYYQPLRIHSWVERNDQEFSHDELGVDVNQTTTFSFLRDDLVDREYFPEVGDIIHWNNIYWEVDAIITNQLLMGKDPATNKVLDSSTEEFGSNWSYQVRAHMARVSRINTEPYHYGQNE